MKCCVMRHFIWVSTACLSIHLWDSCLLTILLGNYDEETESVIKARGVCGCVGWGTLIFATYGLDPTFTVYPKNISGIPKRMFENLATPNEYSHFVPKMHRYYPQK